MTAITAQKNPMPYASGSEGQQKADTDLFPYRLSLHLVISKCALNITGHGYVDR